MGRRLDLRGLCFRIRGASLACVSLGPLLKACRSLGGISVGIEGPSSAGFAFGAVIAMMDGALSSQVPKALIKALEDAATNLFTFSIPLPNAASIGSDSRIIHS